ncbi:MAG TPA: S8 family serine peptidase [Geminicoccaceae bacterium]|nr:S8 family serine peptidase [Geminicoccaceae bacterium]
MSATSRTAVATSVLATFTLASSAIIAQQAGPTAHAPVELVEEANDTFICVFNPARPPADVSARAAALAARHGGTVRHTYTTAIRGFAAALPARAAARLAAQNADVAYCEADGVVSAFGRPGGNAKPPGGGSQAETIPWGISRVGGPADGTRLRAWVIDTGIDLAHPDLDVDLGCSANFVTRGKNSPADGHGHGTHVAGTIAALDNQIDVVGVAAGATLCAVRVLDSSGSGLVSWLVAGVDHVARSADRGDVANLSLGGSGHWQSLHDAIENAADAGILFAIAAGNSGADAGNYEPAHIEHPNVYTVSAIDSEGYLASWSNWGNPPVDFAAPGVSVLSTKKGGGTTTMSGTSMATPHVAGVLLLGTPGCDGNAAADPDQNRDPIVHLSGGGCSALTD